MGELPKKLIVKTPANVAFRGILCVGVSGSMKAT